MTLEFSGHISVFHDECLQYLTENLSDEDAAIFFDGTFGGGGHSFSLLEKCPKSTLIGTDQDLDAYQTALNKIEQKGLKERCLLHHTNFVNAPTEVFPLHEDLLEKRGGLDGILLDLGVSSHQINSAERGFSFLREGPLDMRMNSSSLVPSAKELVNTLDTPTLEKILRDYGEERLSKKIAHRIVERRKEKVFETTKDLEDLVFHCYPPKARHGRIHPATRTFQALRIAVNDELGVLTDSIPKLISYLRPGGRIAIISFHSLEDRIAKHSFKALAQKDNKIIQILTKKPVIPTEEEKQRNSRSRSAKLRVAEKI